MPASVRTDPRRALGRRRAASTVVTVAPVLRWVGRLGALSVLVALVAMLRVGALAGDIGPIPLCFQDCGPADLHDPWERERWIAVGLYVGALGLLGVGWALMGVSRPGADGTGASVPRRSGVAGALPVVGPVLGLLVIVAVDDPAIGASSRVSIALSGAVFVVLLLARAVVIWELLRRDLGSSRAAWYAAAPVAMVGCGLGRLADGLLGVLGGAVLGADAAASWGARDGVLPVVLAVLLAWAVELGCVLVVGRMFRSGAPTP